MVVSFFKGGEGNLIRTELQNEYKMKNDDKEQERKSLLATLQVILLLFSYQTNIKGNAALTF